MPAQIFSFFFLLPFHVYLDFSHDVEFFCLVFSLIKISATVFLVFSKPNIFFFCFCVNPVLGAIVFILASSLVVVLVLWCCKKGRLRSSQFFPRNTSNLSLKRDLEQDSKCFGISVFSYSELEEATNKFDSSKELGDGGFGTVYHGKTSLTETISPITWPLLLQIQLT